MPTRADIEAATPKCPALHDRSKLEQCDLPLWWDHGQELWTCRVHGQVVTATELVAVQRFEADRLLAPPRR